MRVFCRIDITSGALTSRATRLGNAEPDRETWKKAYELFLRAFKEPATETEKKRLHRVLRKPTRKEVADELFEYDAFLRGLGRMSLSECPFRCVDK